MSSNQQKLTENITKGLQGNENILIQSRHSDDNNDIVLDAVEKAGLKLFSMELGDPSKVRKGKWSDESPEDREAKREKTIRSYLKEEKANALLVDMLPESDISTFVKVAKDLNIPLIVSITKDVELNAVIYENKDMLVKAVSGQIPTLAEDKGDVLSRIKEIQNQAVDKSPSKKLNSRI